MSAACCSAEYNVSARAAREKDSRQVERSILEQFGRHVATERHDEIRAVMASRRRPEGHGDALRESAEDQSLDRTTRGNLRHRLVHIRDVVGDQEVAILTRHPAGDGDLGAATVETVKGLDRCRRPRAGDGQGAQLPQHLVGVLSIAVKADHEMERRSRAFLDHDPAVRARGDVNLSHRVIFRRHGGFAA